MSGPVPPTNPRIELRDSGRAMLVLDCKISADGLCKFSVWERAPQAAMWQWDGNMKRPSLTPSIDCHGGCGWHGFIVDGEVKS